MADKIQELRAAYGWLKAFAGSIPDSGNIKRAFVDDYNRIFNALVLALEKPLVDFSPQTIRVWQAGGGDLWCDSAELGSKADQLLGFLEYGYNIEEKVLEVGSLFKSIHDLELRERCGDLIVGAGPFDRVINQATLVLEARLRQRAGLDRGLSGSSNRECCRQSEPG